MSLCNLGQEEKKFHQDKKNIPPLNSKRADTLFPHLPRQVNAHSHTQGLMDADVCRSSAVSLPCMLAVPVVLLQMGKRG